MTIAAHPTRRPRLFVGAGLLALVLGTAACGSSSEGSGATAKGDAASVGTSSRAASTTASSGGTTDTAAAACVKDSEYLSGSSTVVWTPDARSEHQVAETAANHKFTLTAAGTLEPATIEVAVGEVFSVTMADDSQGVSVLTIGCDGGQTMTKGTAAGVYITAPGTYAVTSGLAGDPAGTIVVS